MLIEEKHSTQELTQVLCEARFIQHYFERYKDELITDPPYQYLERKIKEKGINVGILYLLLWLAQECEWERLWVYDGAT